MPWTRPYTDHESDTYPHVIMTSDGHWDPSILDGKFPSTHGQEAFFDASTYNNSTSNFDAYGTYRKGTIVASARSTVMDDPILQGTALPKEMLVTHEYPPDVEPAILPKNFDAANGTHSPKTTNVFRPRTTHLIQLWLSLSGPFLSTVPITIWHRYWRSAKTCRLVHSYGAAGKEKALVERVICANGWHRFLCQELCQW
jgi:hypothetical protein